ncbi:MAG: restriction endonuclease subunit S [Trueperaceae bacterium]|nr:restriction endonuclease subunit S [Trueperaceae bacterium]
MSERSQALEAVRGTAAAYHMRASESAQSEVSPGYTRTEVGTIPEDWEVKTLSQTSEFDWGNTSITKAAYRDHGYQAFSASGPDGYVSWYDHDATAVIVSAIGAKCGRTWLASGKWTAIKNTIWIRPVVGEMDVKFLFIATGEPGIWPKSGQAQPFISLGGIKTVRLPVPPLREQRAIATTLSDADALIESLDRLIAKKRAIKQATMQQLLTGQTRLPGFTGEWKTKRLANVAEIDPENLGENTPPHYTFHYISLEDVEEGKLRGWSTERFRSAPVRARRILRRDDIMVSTVRPNLKSHLLFDGQLQNAICSTGFTVVRSDPSHAHPGFIYSHFFGSTANQQINKIIAGSNYPAIGSRDVKNLELPMPDLEEQAAIAEVLTDMDAEIEALERRRDKTRQIKQGMMQQLLTGRTRLVKPEVAA